MRTVVALFNELGDAGRTLGALKDLGLREDQISVISQETAPPSLADLHFDRMNLGGVGEVAACGPLMRFLTPSTAASAPDALARVLTRMGLSPQEAQLYVDGVKRGYTLEAALVEDDKADRALDIMKRSATTERTEEEELELETRRTGEAVAEREEIRGRTGAEEVRVPVAQEELRVGKREIPKGGIRVSTHVISQPVAEEISLREETVDVERRATERPAEEGAFREQVVEVSAISEEPVISKSAHVVEEVVVRKGAETRTETVKDTIRKTDVNVENLDYDASAYQEHFRQQYGKSRDARFEEYEPAYRFGHQIRGQAAGAEWSSIEPSARTSWEAKKPGTWDRFKDAIRHAWQRAKS